ncbi:hypothetical protein MJ588_13585 [Klebsiella pneumoniae]|nr:hypothetical protein MJ588_13585 [Klebsiella pneumoniae]
MSGKIINLSAESADGGVNLTTSVTHPATIRRGVRSIQMLELAARRTTGIDRQIAPVNLRKLGLLD